MISVVVITRNEEANILRTLESLSDSRISEIIVSDSDSSDSTRDIVELYATRDERVSFHTYNSSPFTAARGRNEGARRINAQSDFILFIDGDMELVSGFLYEGVNTLKTTANLAVVSGQMDNVFYDSDCCAVRLQPNYYEISHNKIGGAMLVKKAPFFDCGCFNQSLIVSEEAELEFRLSSCGYKFKRISTPMIIHHTELPMSKARFRERFFDGKFTAVSQNIKLSFQQKGYWWVLVNGHKYAFIAAFCIVSSLLFLLIGYHFFAVINCAIYYIAMSVHLKSVRLPANYLFYGVGIIFGYLSNIKTLMKVVT